MFSLWMKIKYLSIKTICPKTNNDFLNFMALRKIILLFLLLNCLLKSNAQQNEMETFNKLSDLAFRRVLCGNALSVFAPDKTYILGDSITIYWNPEKKATSFSIVFQTMFDEEVLKKEVENTELRIATKDIRPEMDSITIWQVNVIDLNARFVSERRLMKFLSLPKIEELKMQRDEILNRTSFKSSVEKFLALATFYEKNNLHVEAIASYASAFTTKDQSKLVKKEYTYYLERITRRKILD
jgi:hypothetical protein